MKEGKVYLMADQEQQTEAPYIREKIKKKKPHPGRMLFRILMCVLLAVVFGAVAGFVFVVVRPWAEQIGVISESSTPSPVELPTYSNMSPTTTQEETEPQETTTIDDEEVAFNDVQRQWIRNLITSLIDRDTADMADVDALDSAFNKIYTQAQKSLVTISGYGDEEGQDGPLWQSIGMLFYENEETDELLILADTTDFGDTAHMQVQISTFPDEAFAAQVKGWDHIFGLAVISISTDSISKEDHSKIWLTELGNSYLVGACDTVLVVGKPYGITGSVALGRVTCVDTDRTTLDSVYRLFDTDLVLPDGAGGFMLNTDGQLVGILTASLSDASLSQYGAAIGIEELKGSINNMMNGTATSLLGVYASDVTQELVDAGMPAGVYVRDVQVNGPAYNAGISAGDVITGISMSEITSVSELTQCMTEKNRPEETVIVQIMRQSPEGYKGMEVSVTLGAR